MTVTVPNGATSAALVVSSGSANQVTVASGGTITGATIQSGGTILLSGYDSGSIISAGGIEDVFGTFGSATADQIYGTQVVSAASAVVLNETVFGGGTLDLFLAGGVASNTTLQSGAVLNISGHAVASNTVINGGTLVLQSPKAVLSGSVTFNGGGTILVTSASSAGYGDLAVIGGFASGGVIDETTFVPTTSATTVSGGNTVLTLSSGSYVQSYIFSGSVGSNLKVVTDGGTGERIYFSATNPTNTVSSGQISANLVVASGAANQLLVMAGGTATGATVLSGGIATISGTDSGSVISAGGTEAVLHGSALADQIYGTQSVSLASVTGESVYGGGTLIVGSGGVATNTVISGGAVVLSAANATLAGTVGFWGTGTILVESLFSAGAGDQAPISGFTTGDAVDFWGITGLALSVTSSGGNTVATVSSGGASQSYLFSGTQIGNSLTLVADGHGGQELTVIPTPTLTAFTMGDLVISEEGNGAGTGMYADNAAAPLVLQEITTNGSIIGEMVLPQTTSVVNGTTEYAISGEYGSASEALLQLSGDGQSLVIAGYGVNAAAYNLGGAAVYGNAALAQSTSVPGGSYTVVPRVIADISYSGTVDTSTALTNVFNTNNPRSVATLNGSSFYVSGQGVKGDTTQGVFVAADGATSATAIDTSTDTRSLQIVGGQLVISRDSPIGTPSTASIATYGATLPATATTAAILPGINESITLTAAQENSVNAGAVGSTVYLSPENFFFASPTVLYVADGGQPKAGGVGDGGLQKWVFNGTQWNLAYTVSSGLNLVSEVNALHGVTGLIGLTGTVVNGVAQLYATTETMNDLDQSFLVGIADTVSATTAAGGEAFTTLEASTPDTKIRGVAFAPTAASVVSGVTDVASGVTSTGLIVTSGAGNALTVEAGGTLVSATLNSGGTITMSGTENWGLIQAGGSETVLGSAAGDQVDGSQTVSGAAELETVFSGGLITLAGNATGTAITVLGGGTLDVAGAALASATTLSGGVLQLEAGSPTLTGAIDFAGTATLAMLGTQSIAAPIAGFAASDVVALEALHGGTLTTTSSGGALIATVSSGAVTESFTFTGLNAGSLVLNSGAYETIGFVPTVGKALTVSNAQTSNYLTVSSGTINALTVLSGGSIVSAGILSGGFATVSSGGTDSASVISSGGTETLYGAATGDAIYGTQLLSASGATSYAVATNETVYGGGSLNMTLKGAVANGTTVMNGGSIYINGSASAVNTVLSGGGLINMNSPKASLGGSVTMIGSGNVVEVTSVTSAGFHELAVISGFGAGDVFDETTLSFTSTTVTSAFTGGNTIYTFRDGSLVETATIAGAVALEVVTDSSGGTELIACYAEGTHIATPRGECAVEALVAGDTVSLATGGTGTVRWLGHRTIDCARHKRPELALPVRVRAHAFADGAPHRDLVLSPEHAVFIDGRLIPVRCLVNGATIVQEQAERITWYHVELEHHAILLAEGLPAESYLDTGNRAAFANAGPAMQAQADFTPLATTGFCAELVTDGPAIAAARRHLLARAAAMGFVASAENDLHILADGVVIRPDLHGELARFIVPAATRDLRIVSRGFVPAHLQPEATDTRLLGLPIAAITLDDGLHMPVGVAMDDARLLTGWHAAEFDGGQRWTNGDATLPAELWAGCTGSFFLRLHVLPHSIRAWQNPRLRLAA